MADNVTLPATGQIIRTVEINGIDYQVCLLADGTTGAVIGSTLLTNGRGINVVMLNDAPVKGMAATGQDAPPNPVPAGLQVTTTLLGTPLANGKVSPLYGTPDGLALVRPWCHPSNQLPTLPVALTTTGDVALFGAQAAGIKIALLGFVISNTSSTNTEVLVKEGTTVLARFAAPAADRSGGVAALPLPLYGTAATAMNVALSGAATTVYVTPFAYRSAV